MKRILLIMIFMLVNAFTVYSQSQDSLLQVRRSTMFPRETTSGMYYDIATIKNENNIKFPFRIFKYHPLLGEMLSEKLKDSLTLEVQKKLRK